MRRLRLIVRTDWDNIIFLLIFPIHIHIHITRILIRLVVLGVSRCMDTDHHPHHRQLVTDILDSIVWWSLNDTDRAQLDHLIILTVVFMVIILIDWKVLLQSQLPVVKLNLGTTAVELANTEKLGRRLGPRKKILSCLVSSKACGYQ